MMFKTTVLLLISSLLLIQTHISETAKLRNVVVQKSVSVNLPERRTHAVNHFNPAGHVYAATGGVIIDEGNADRRPVETTRRVFKPSPQYNEAPRSVFIKPAVSNFNLQRTVSVQSPKRVSSTINHFNPAGHIYAATGNVKIQRNPTDGSSTQTKTTYRIPPQVRAPAPIKVQTVTTNIITQPASVVKTFYKPAVFTSSASGLNLERTVSVKSPQRVTSVIDHFNPAGHIYAATGNVKIQRNPNLSSSAATKTTYRAPTKVRAPAPIKVETVTTEIRTQPATVVKTFYKPAVIKSSSGLDLERIVSVKSPHRATSVINHFNPAGHIYAATGNVKIQKSTSESSDSSSSSKTTYKVPIRRIPVSKPVKVEYYTTEIKSKPAKIARTVYKSAAVKPSLSGLHLERTVSVKSPQRLTSVIDHFNPAGHIYAATGNVKIQRNPTVSSSTATKTTYRAPTKVRAPALIKVETVKTEIRTQPAKVVKTVYKPAIIKSSALGLNLDRTVSVKSPQRITSVINHFDPAGHIYAATGNVNIQKFTPASSGSTTFSSKSTTYRNPVKVPSVKVESVRTEIRKQPAKVVKTVYKPAVIKSFASGLHLERTVSVKSPQRVTSVIDHFNPAGHVYAATGNVKIQRNPTVSSSTATKTTYRAPTKVRTPAPIKYETVKTEIRTQPAKVVKTIYKPAIIKSSASGLNLDRTVSVKSPQRITSVINHFDPAGHIYAATGNVKIQKFTPASSGSTTFSSKRTTYKNPVKVLTKKVENVRTVTRKQPAKVVKTVYKPAVIKSSASGLNLERTVSVKSPQRITSVIDHFNPAGHVYAATGNVKIQRNPTVSSSTATKTTYRAPTKVRTPAPIKYETIKTEIRTQPAKVVKTIYRPAIIKSSASGLNLDRTVSVKSPQRITSVINHFDPAGHIYAATGNVKIQKFTPASSGTNTFSSKKTTYKSPVNVQSVKVESVRTEIRKQPAKVVKTVYKPAVIKSSASGLHLERTVSVKSPQRLTSVIDHFNPAGHVYAATGNVKIQRNPTVSSSTATKTTYRAPTKVRAPAPIKFETVKTEIRTQPAKVVKTGYKPTIIKSSASGLNLDRTVSVKSPQRITSVINHFDPAGHIYAATGNVKIQKSSPASSGSSTFSSKSTTYKNPIKVPSVKVESVRTEIRKQPAKVVKTVYKPAVIKSSASGLNLERTVSVKSPQRLTSVIDHFNPAGHIYAATGNVKIQRNPTVSSSTATKTTYRAPTKVRTPAPIKVKTVKTEIRTQPVKVVKTVYKPSVIKSSSSSSGLNLDRTVSVKSPQRITSVINHFNPAGHVYAATGNVKIQKSNSIISGSSSGVETTYKAPIKIINIKTETKDISSDELVDSSSEEELDIIIKKSQSSTVNDVVEEPAQQGYVFAPPKGYVYNEPDFLGSYLPPVRSAGSNSPINIESLAFALPSFSVPVNPSPRVPAQIVPEVKIPVVPEPSANNFHLHKSVSVNLPERRTSLIDHFNPAGHKYAATGSVTINKSS